MAPNTQPEIVDTPIDSIPHWYSPEDDSISINDGSGAYVYDEDGTEYLDFLSQLYCVNAGHNEERIIEKITEQLQQIPYVSSAKKNETRTEFARRLTDIAPESLSDVMFSISGSEANETAIQIAREYTGSQKVLTRWRSYHGSTYGAASLTGDPETRATVERHAAVTGAAKFLPPMIHRSPFDGDTPEEIGQQAADHLEFVIRNEGPDSIAAILTEPVAGTSGAYPAPPGYFERVRELCNKYDILLISDEVIAGFGRCGDWFGIQTEGVEPDMITFAKGVTSAYVPLAGVLASDEIGSWLKETGFELGQTFAGHPVGCAAGLGALDVYEDELIENVQLLEDEFQNELKKIEERYEAVGSVHGRGFLWSVEFTDPETGEPFVDPRIEDSENPVKQVREIAAENGVLFGSGRPDIQVLLSPPLCINSDKINKAISVLDSAINEIFE
ncbi:acetylornithine transaminase [Natrinema pellirubrum DSM 15624]|uniref:Acetylornithine transaminase n=1 Tax=Natrinema pellirubrum (strain DSM 15624 / CIP 106293 / JCM 10476 / NCIMB 786 / 157) TaxID=797303 RepID=L0JKB3_NATP1|nr:aspartate aminotransferase family protein [Natrinema pellirubrum]AGB31714.1 adenosylmethionine-8-amino-7-oxononanoate aminotransferase [Natrinema pellirubrum DSM 15624]ELY72922.1 acetylornithine transaminase [Natrinema pellirubrum DSM 15624]